MRHIVVCGYPRAGTTLFYNMLRTTVSGFQFYDREIRADVAHKKDPGLDKITKRPTDMADAPELMQTIPGIEFILCIRDPRCVLVSEHAHAPGQYKIGWDWALKTCRRQGVIGKAPGMIERDQKARAIQNCAYVLKYEGLIQQTEQVQADVGRFFGFEYKADFTEWHTKKIPGRLSLQLNGVRPVEESRMESWRQHPDRIKQQFSECPALFEAVRFWGYETDDSWIDEL